jgi:hypothetical protein
MPALTVYVYALVLELVAWKTSLFFANLEIAIIWGWQKNERSDFTLFQVVSIFEFLTNNYWQLLQQHSQWEILDLVLNYGEWIAYFVLHEERRSFVKAEAIIHGLNQLHIRNLKKQIYWDQIRRRIQAEESETPAKSRDNL